ncbi:MAG: glycosyltransferase family 2 protein [Sedimentisphaerales bacterium]|nr:glycosyltransferase family 2 protein [Sedimentisphaerales bacterium]
MNNLNKYIIITPAFNEAGFIEKTIEGVLCQTIPAQKWIIVDDGSNDATAEIIKKYSTRTNFIQYHYREKLKEQEYFSSNVHAIMEGYRQVKSLEFDFLAILDADITLPRDYYEKILNHFYSDRKLGVASGIYEDLVNGKLYNVLSDRRYTPKAIQVFRREVFENIGGFIPLKYGGEDTTACVMARMAGWKAWSFPDIKVIHHRATGMGNSNKILKARFVQGLAEYSLGSHWLFILGKSIKRALKERPFLIGGLFRLVGYVWGFILGEKRIVTDEFVSFFRKEQMARVLSLDNVKNNV